MGNKKLSIYKVRLRTYSGVEFETPLLFPKVIQEGKVKAAKEDIADEWAMKTRYEDDPVVSCVQVFYNEL